MTSTQQDVRNLDLSEVVLNPDALRSVNTDREEYEQLRDSIANHGVIQPILVRPAPDGSGKFMLVDGAHRYTASKELGLPGIMCVIGDCDDLEAYEKQIITNLHQVKTKPAEYARHLDRMLTRDPMLTIPQLASKINVSPSWLHSRLKLNRLTDDIKKLVDGDEIVVTNAQNLAALPDTEQTNWITDAMTMPPDLFKAKVDQRVKEIRSAKREGRDPNATSEFVPVARLRKLAELKETQATPGLIAAIVGDKTDPIEAGSTILLWAIQLDPDSIATATKKDTERKQAASDAKIEARAQRAAKREAAAAKAKAEALAEAKEKGVTVNLDG